VKQKELFGREIESGEWRRLLLMRLDSEQETELANRLRQCGKVFHLWCRGCGHRHDAETKCCRKWCPSCAPKRANERAAKMRLAFRLMQWPLHVTFTVPNEERGVVRPTALKELMAAFRKLRTRRLWKERVKGGVVSCEVTDTGNGLHPHLHALIDCRWLALTVPEPHWSDDSETIATKCRCAAEELTALWATCCKDDRVRSVKIRRVGIGAVEEVLKYALKSEDAAKCQGRIGPVLRALDSIRTVATFGSVHGLKVPDEDEHRLVCKCGERDWTPQPPESERTPRLDARQLLAQQRAAETDAALARILAEEATREV